MRWASAINVVAGRALAILHVARPWWTDRYIWGEKLTPDALSPAWQSRLGDYVWINLWPIDYRLFDGEEARTVRLEVRDGMLLLGGDAIVPESDTLAFTAGLGFTIGRGRGNAVRVESSDGLETLWFRGQAARRVRLSGRP